MTLITYFYVLGNSKRMFKAKTRKHGAQRQRNIENWTGKLYNYLILFKIYIKKCLLGLIGQTILLLQGSLSMQKFVKLMCLIFHP